jgi:hypothetical protein
MLQDFGGDAIELPIESSATRSARGRKVSRIE